jgi:uncharacterized Zn finger protein (UPF0148 family)
MTDKACPCCGARLFHEDGWVICYSCGYERDLTNAILQLFMPPV